MGYLLDTIREILYYLRQYKARTFMTMFGIIWGTVTIVVLLAFGVGLESFLSREMHGLGESIVIMWPGQTSIAWKGYGRERQIRFRMEDAELLKREIPSIKHVSPEYSRWSTSVRFEDKKQQPNISGVNVEYGMMRNIWPQPGGRWLNQRDFDERRRVVFLGDDLKEFLFGEKEDAIGKYVYIGETPFIVVGVLKQKSQNSSYSSRDKDRAFIPATTHHAVFGHRYINNIIYQLEDPRLSESIQSDVYEVFSKKYRFDPEDTEALAIWDTSEMDKMLFGFTLGFNLFMGLIGLITLVVGGIGLANIMYVVVQERTKEIGIRRAMGAKRRHIMLQFILEAFIIIGFSALIGFIVSYGIIKLMGMLPLDRYVGTPHMSWPVAALAVTILGVIGLLAGYFPSRKAASLNVVDSLRY
ncbi:ABC transporter permease [bacterium]|nr:ABC transporter permease [bacterium]